MNVNFKAVTITFGICAILGIVGLLANHFPLGATSIAVCVVVMMFFAMIYNIVVAWLLLEEAE